MHEGRDVDGEREDATFADVDASAMAEEMYRAVPGAMRLGRFRTNGATLVPFLDDTLDFPLPLPQTRIVRIEYVGAAGRFVTTAEDLPDRGGIDGLIVPDLADPWQINIVLNGMDVVCGKNVEDVWN